MNIEKITKLLNNNYQILEELANESTPEKLVLLAKTLDIEITEDMAKKILPKLDVPLDMETLEKVVGGVRGNRSSFNQAMNKAKSE